MQKTEQVSFTLDLQDAVLHVSEHQVRKNQVYRVVFPDHRKPLVIHQAIDYGGDLFWTSIPEGRQQEAETIGTLVDLHLKKKKDVLL